jgi:hypothetical protein
MCATKNHTAITMFYISVFFSLSLTWLKLSMYQKLYIIDCCTNRIKISYMYAPLIARHLNPKKKQTNSIYIIIIHSYWITKNDHVFLTASICKTDEQTPPNVNKITRNAMIRKKNDTPTHRHTCINRNHFSFSLSLSYSNTTQQPVPTLSSEQQPLKQRLRVVAKLPHRPFTFL